MTGKELTRLLNQNCWTLRRITGSHHILKKGDAIVVVPVHGNSDLKPGTLNSILRRAGLK